MRLTGLLGSALLLGALSVVPAGSGAGTQASVPAMASSARNQTNPVLLPPALKGRVQFLPDGRLLSQDATQLGLWTGDGSRRLSTLTLADDEMGTVRLTPDGRFLATGSYTGRFTIRSTADWRKLAVITDPGSWPQNFALSPDGVYLSVCKLEPVAGRLEFSLHGWDLRSGRLAQRLHVLTLPDVFPGHPPSTAVAFHPHGGWLSAGVEDMNEPGFGRVRVRNLRSGSWVYELPGYLPLEYSPDGSGFLYAESVGKSVALRHWDLRRGLLRRLMPLSKSPQLGTEAAVLSPDGRYAAWFGAEEHEHLELLVSETGSGKIVLRSQVSDRADNLAFSPDAGRLLVSSLRDADFAPQLYRLP